MKKRNLSTFTLGKQLNNLDSRYENIDRIVSSFTAENPVYQTFLIEGIHGSGKTALMKMVAKQLAEENDWIVINLNPKMNLLTGLAIKLCDEYELTPDADYVGVIERIGSDLVRKRKRVLVTIDEVVHDDNMRAFVSQFQIFLRQDFPFFAIMTGIHDNIYKIQNDPYLTFMLRSPKIVTAPLNKKSKEEK